MPELRLGTRGSPLALAQTREVAERLIAARPHLAAPGAIETVVIRTSGDRLQDRPLAEIGGKGLFTKEIEEALSDGRIDVAVHSMKDVPSSLPAGLAIGAILPREDPRDALFARPVSGGAGQAPRCLAALPPGALVGTASLRRQAQLLLARPDLRVVPLRGNVETRLAKLAAGQFDATLLAAAGLKRLGRSDLLSALLSTEEMLPAAAQGAIGLELRLQDTRTYELVAVLQDRESAWRVAAERACLAVLEGTCRTPIAALAEVEGERLRLRALLAAPDGSRAYRSSLTAGISEACELGRAAGEALRRDAGASFFSLLGGA